METVTIFRREVDGYFTSPFAYFIAAGFLLFCGILFARDFQDAATQTIPINPAFIPTVISFLMVFFAPLLTMRLLAEEKREGTMELLLTSPASEGSIVLGKFFSAWFYYTILLLLTLTYQLVLLTYAPPDLGHAFLAYLGVWLYGGAMIAIGLFFSSITENQIVSAFLSMVTLLILYIGDAAGQVIGNIDVARAIRSLSLQGHFSTSFQVGILRAEDVAFFAGIIILMLYLSIRVVEAQRWR